MPIQLRKKSYNTAIKTLSAISSYSTKYILYDILSDPLKGKFELLMPFFIANLFFFILETGVNLVIFSKVDKHVKIYFFKSFIH